MLNMIDDVAADVWCPTECYSPRKSPPMNHVVIKYLYVEAAGRISGERSIISFVTSGIGGRQMLFFMFSLGCVHCYYDKGLNFNNSLRPTDQKILRNLSCI
jgi:hypothetical protein